MVTFGRAGEDNKKFKLGDVEQTLAGFAGADYDLQARLSSPLVQGTSRSTGCVHAAQKAYEDAGSRLRCAAGHTTWPHSIAEQSIHLHWCSALPMVKLACSRGPHSMPCIPVTFRGITHLV